MTTADFIIALFYRVDNQMSNVANIPMDRSMNLSPTYSAAPSWRIFL